jgi:hypothetical protein
MDTTDLQDGRNHPFGFGNSPVNNNQMMNTNPMMNNFGGMNNNLMNPMMNAPRNNMNSMNFGGFNNQIGRQGMM